MNIIEPSVQLVWITPNPLEAIEMSARVCYKSEAAYDPAKSGEFVDRIVHQRHHESVVEHAAASFHIVCDRGVSHEIVRHRLASYSQESTRYCNYSKERHGSGINLSPMYDNLNDMQIARREALYRHIEEVYLDEIEEGVSPQQARDNLPTCLKTEIRMTANFREWMHFLKLRTAPSAHPQMRKIAAMIEAILQRECPEIFGQPQSS